VARKSKSPPAKSSKVPEFWEEDPTEVKVTLELVLAGIQNIEKRLDGLSADISLTRLAQVEHGKKLGELDTQCRRRLEYCSGHFAGSIKDYMDDGNGGTRGQHSSE